MTDNIQKLYEVAGVRNSTIYFCPSCGSMLYSIFAPDGISYKCEKEPHCDYELNSWDEEFEDCINYLNKRNIIPPFTAEKQLELIKLVSNFKVYETVKHKGGKWFMCASIGCNDYCESRHEHFDQALAGLILELWDELSSEQREEVKGILQ